MTINPSSSALFFCLKGGEKMKKQQDSPRLLNLPQAMTYTGIGKTNLKKWLTEIGAVVRVGRKVLYDRETIDKAITERKGLA